jgi:hypothetical protein
MDESATGSRCVTLLLIRVPQRAGWRFSSLNGAPAKSQINQGEEDS